MLNNEYYLKFKLNGEEIQVMVNVEDSLLEVLRDKLYLTGVKKGCGEGVCGACTVIVENYTVNSCIYPALKVKDKNVLTIEGLSKQKEMHPIQEAFISEGAVQCGFCTPGAILSAKCLLDNNPAPSEEEIKKGLSGNICRCTGYIKMIKAVQTASQSYNNKT